MDPTSAIADRSSVETVVLLGVVARLDETDGTARADEIRSVCNERLDAVTGRLSEADVARALNQLTDLGLLEHRASDEASAVGKGRPSYVLEPEPEVVLDALRDDDAVASLAETVAAELEE